MKLVTIFAFVSLLCVSCGSTLFGGNTPDPNVWYQDDLFCWYNDPHAGRWVVRGPNHTCPYGTRYAPGPPVDPAE